MNKFVKSLILVLAGLSIGLATSIPLPICGASIIRLVINGQEITPEVPPQIINGRTMVPIRAVAEGLGASVSWDETAQTVIINSGEGATSISTTSVTSTVVNSLELQNIDNKMNTCFLYIDTILKQEYVTEDDLSKLSIKMNEIAEVLAQWNEIPQYANIKGKYISALTSGSTACSAKQMMKNSEYDTVSPANAYMMSMNDYQNGKIGIQAEKMRLQKLGY